MHHARSKRRWTGGAIAVALLMTGPAFAQPSGSDATSPPSAGTPPATPDNTEAIEQALEQLDTALARWSRSCRKPDAHGLCIAIAPVARSEFRCDGPRLGRVRVAARRGKAAGRAHQALSAAITNAEKTGPPTDPALAPRYWDTLTRARLARSDRELERTLALELPTGLDFFVEEWKKGSGIPKWEKQYEAQNARKKDSERRFKAFFEQKAETSRELHQAYRQAVDQAPLPAKPSIALRQAFVAQHMADQLRSAFIPESLRKAELRDAYCDALATHAEPLEQQAHEAVWWCTELAAEHTLAGPAVDSCRSLLEHYPESPPGP